MAKQERKVLQEMAFDEADFDANQQRIMGELRAAWALAKELNAELAQTFEAMGPDGDIVISHKPWDKKITWYAKREAATKVARPSMSLAQYRALQEANGRTN